MTIRSDISQRHGYPVVALTGFMAAGKSTVGRALASLLRWSFLDLDYEIEQRTGRTIREIFARDGETYFRQLETDVLGGVLASVRAPTVIALGGGTFVQAENAAALRQHGARVVFLHTELQRVLLRCRQADDRSVDNPRPLAIDEAAFCALYEQRLPYYRQADFTYETHGRNADRAARDIAAALGLSRSEKRL